MTKITHQKWHIEVVFSSMREVAAHCPLLTDRSSVRFQQPKMLHEYTVTALDQMSNFSSGAEHEPFEERQKMES